jgi:hypothetical protein
VGAVLIGVRVPPAELDEIDAWIKQQAKPKPSRPEAIRRLVEMAIATARPSGPTSKKTAAKARQIAAETIDRLVDPSAPPAEQAKRKHRLLKGPPEFREMRSDVAKAKV